MDQSTIDFIRKVLPEGRTVFHAFPDRYACILLEHALRDQRKKITDIKNSCLSPLLNKPCIKHITANRGDGNLEASDLIKAWPLETDPYRLTLGTWPKSNRKPEYRWDQTTRWGWNLVLQLNVSLSHRRDLHTLVPDWKSEIEYSGHPIAQNGELTLAWSRIDLDLGTEEALIEEVQSDWVRDVHSNTEYSYGDEEEQEKWKIYEDKLLKPMIKTWPENMLTATLWFLLSELGIKRLFYHTHESGSHLKRIHEYHPPRSLYTDLPRKFCFEKTHYGPLFIRDSKHKQLRKKFIDPSTQWQVLDFNSIF